LKKSKIDRVVLPKDGYLSQLLKTMSEHNWEDVEIVGEVLGEARRKGNCVYLCGNGGSAANANHLANDFLYGARSPEGVGFNVESLAANSAVITCLANDVGYEYIFSSQLEVKGQTGDVLIALSGSGNSKNVINAISLGNSLSMHTVAILGFSGGECRELAQYPIHFPVSDMQIAEDMQLIVGHMLMQAFKRVSGIS